MGDRGVHRVNVRDFQYVMRSATWEANVASAMVNGRSCKVPRVGLLLIAALPMGFDSITRIH